MKSAEEQKKTPVAHKHYTSERANGERIRLKESNGYRNWKSIGLDAVYNFSPHPYRPTRTTLHHVERESVECVLL